MTCPLFVIHIKVDERCQTANLQMLLGLDQTSDSSAPKCMIGNAFRHQQAKVVPGVNAYRIAIKRRKSARLVARRWRPSKYRHRNVCTRVQRRRKQTDGYRDIS